MVWDVLRFYITCLKRAFADWFKQVSGWASILSLLVGIVPFIGKLPVIQEMATATPAIEKIVNAIPTFFLIGVFTIIVAVRMILAPYWLYRDERQAREAIESARQPKLVIGLPEPPVINSILLRGGTTESLAGTHQTVIHGREMDVVALICKNAGEVIAKGCRTRILSATRLTPDGKQELGVVESIELPWKKEDPEGSHVIDIPPSETRRIWIGGVRSRGHIWIFRDRKSLPIEYQQLLGAAGTYRVLIQVDGENIPPQQILLEIIAAEGPTPHSGVWRGTAAVTIVAQGAPRIADEPNAG